MGLHWSGAEVDPLFNTANTDRKRRLATRTSQRVDQIAALDREREYAEVDLMFARKALELAAAKADEFEKAGKPGRALVARLEQAKSEERIDRKLSTIENIAVERARWVSKKPDRDSDW